MFHNENSKQKVYVFGAASTALSLLGKLKDQYHIVAFVDNDEKKWGSLLEGFPILAPEKLMGAEYDKIIVASLTGQTAIKSQLLKMNIDISIIDTDFVSVSVQSRINFIEQLAQLFEENQVGGAVAEGGVFQGEFAREINRVFPNKTLYLFDTFSGFDDKDMAHDQSNQFSHISSGNHLISTNVELVKRKLPFIEKCVICQGYFPETTIEIDTKETFCFVNLDFDLYLPILAGLEYFYPRMEKGGVILIHDYFTEGFKGVKAAVLEFEKKIGQKLLMYPIGDGVSIAVFCL